MRASRLRFVSVLLPFAVLLVVSASASAFEAHGSAEQVYATGVAPNAKVWLKGHGKTITQYADSLGGALFRNVKPGKGYRVFTLAPRGKKKKLHKVKSARLTVYTTAAAPWDPSIYNQEIPDNGYRI